MTIKEKKKQMLARMWKKWNPHMLLEGIQNGVAALVDILVVPQNVKHRIIK